MRKYTNTEFIQLLSQNDEEAFAAFYEKYHRMILYVAYKTMKNEADARDVMQDTFIQIRKSIQGVRNPDYLQLWINRIAVNKCNNIFRKRKEVSLDAIEIDVSKHEAFIVKDYIPVKNAHFSSDKELLLEFMDFLPAVQRLMLTLMYFEQMSIAEIAYCCNVPEGTVKSRLSTARKSLRDMIEKYEEREGVKLNFQASDLGAVLVSALLAQSSKVALPVTSSLYSLLKTCKNAIVSTLEAGKGILLLGSGALAISATYAIGSYVVEQYSEPKQLPLQNIHNANATTEKITPEVAYFTIMMWANTPQIMEQKDSKNIQDYQTYYDVIKAEEGIYWQLLKQSGITSYFES